MAEIAKLSVGKALEKLRSADAPKASKMMRIEEEVRAAEEEIKRLRATRLRLRRGQPRAKTET